MKKILLLSLLCIGFTSCQSQKKMDLEKITFEENINNLIKDKQYEYKDKDIFYYVPSYYLIDLKDFSYGNIAFNEEDGSVYFYLNPKTDKIEGYCLNVFFNENKASNLEDYLLQTYNKPIRLKELTEEEREDSMGQSTYYWENRPTDKTSIFVVKTHSISNDKPEINLSVYVFLNSVKYYYPHNNKFDKVTDFMKEHLK